MNGQIVLGVILCLPLIISTFVVWVTRWMFGRTH